MPGLVVVGPAMRDRSGARSTTRSSSRRGAPVEVRVAERGDKRRLRELAERNAKLALAQDRLRRERRRQQRVDALAALQEALGLDELPVRIEGFDVSNLGPEHTVASMVVFEGGAPKKAHYRKFKIRGDRVTNGGDRARGGADPMTSRRSRRCCRGAWRATIDQVDLSPHDAERDESFASLPALIVIDGGKGQLSAGMRALAPLAEQGTAVIGLAKQLEEVFVPGRAAPVPIPRDSEALRLLQRVRDEAHRFAIEYHRGRRDRAMQASVLDELAGVGPARKRALLTHFGSPERFLEREPRGARGGAGHPRQARARHPPAAPQGGMSRGRWPGRRPQNVDLFVITGYSGAGQVGGDRRLRGQRLLLRRQPAAADDRRARRALPPRGQPRAPRRRGLRRARRRLLR